MAGSTPEPETKPEQEPHTGMARTPAEKNGRFDVESGFGFGSRFYFRRSESSSGKSEVDPGFVQELFEELLLVAREARIKASDLKEPKSKPIESAMWMIFGFAIIVAITAGATEIMRVLGVSLQAVDGSDNFYATWAVLAAALTILVLSFHKVKSSCYACYVNNVYNNDAIRGPDAMVYLNLKLSPDDMGRYTQVRTLVRATTDFKMWGQQAVQLQGTAATLNLVINLCGALVPTLIAFSGLYPEVKAMKRTCDVIAIVLSITSTVCNAVQKYFNFAERAGVCRSSCAELVALCNEFVGLDDRFSAPLQVATGGELPEGERTYLPTYLTTNKPDGTTETRPTKYPHAATFSLFCKEYNRIKRLKTQRDSAADVALSQTNPADTADPAQHARAPWKVQYENLKAVYDEQAKKSAAQKSAAQKSAARTD